MKEIPYGGKIYKCPFADLLPDLDRDGREELKEDIRKNGVLVKVVVDDEDNVIDGINRLEIAAALNLDYVPIEVFNGTVEEKRTRALVLNLHRRHLDREKRRELIAALLKLNPEKSNLAIAQKAGVSSHTVDKVREDLEAHLQIAHVETRTDTNGRRSPARRPRKAKQPVERGKEDVPAEPEETPARKPHQVTEAVAAPEPPAADEPAAAAEAVPAEPAHPAAEAAPVAPDELGPDEHQAWSVRLWAAARDLANRAKELRRLSRLEGERRDPKQLVELVSGVRWWMDTIETEVFPWRLLYREPAHDLDHFWREDQGADAVLQIRRLMFVRFNKMLEERKDEIETAGFEAATARLADGPTGPASA